MGIARTTDLADQIKVTKGTVSNMMQHLKEHDLIRVTRYKGVNLTNEGKKRALEVVRRHRLSERLLTDILHLDWSKVHEEACKLEHALSEEVTNCLDKALGHPSTCPHGNPIPTKSGDILEERSKALTTLNLGEEGIVVKITDEESELLQYLNSLGLTPGTSLEVEGKGPYNGLITVKVNGATKTLSREVASAIHVKKINWDHRP
jgi:DtxR family Mn-dependent transcriptional regulator